jgi:hypothetical protein
MDLLTPQGLKIYNKLKKYLNDLNSIDTDELIYEINSSILIKEPNPNVKYLKYIKESEKDFINYVSSEKFRVESYIKSCYFPMIVNDMKISEKKAILNFIIYLNYSLKFRITMMNFTLIPPKYFKSESKLIPIYNGNCHFHAYLMMRYKYLYNIMNYKRFLLLVMYETQFYKSKNNIFRNSY